MSEDIIMLNNVGVKFSTSATARSIADLWNSLFIRNTGKEKFFWALKNVSFTVKKGEIVSVIGKNGAGKSTLLRVVGQILQPDEGSIEIKTKCNLLSSGIGQKPLLSGKENIYLGCLLLGHSMKEIKENFESMVEFAELKEHINRPIRYYSSGMLSRLLFTIATSIKPNFLLLDELLSAGDIGFVDKANKRMQEIIKKSDGCLIATHDMNFARNISTRSLYLKDGQVRFFGNPNEAVDMYEKDLGLK
ncbi:ABC transporter ATP-binding protein [Candidatus Nitrosotenuis uzonensis]|uniref:Capsular polysaccharide export system, ATPase component n=1 Tax=Candidatus Nitrosotenuis uzonensis TaxID=1407055 RepID=A0A812EUB4_9ARCH|nr:ATP-binding cassette domain-containing protein [Candidatus Nitrosotenuis uzonensis]CAE6486911.1 Capsular polysaccharide export system, ATPase component [Candidatus Nitrosotenuis uzonensis]